MATDESAATTDRETVEMDSPLYHVTMPTGMPDAVFGEGEYSDAFEFATGQAIDEAGDDHEDESRINIIDFNGSTEVPVIDDYY